MPDSGFAVVFCFDLLRRVRLDEKVRAIQPVAQRSRPTSRGGSRGHGRPRSPESPNSGHALGVVAAKAAGGGGGQAGGGALGGMAAHANATEDLRRKALEAEGATVPVYFYAKGPPALPFAPPPPAPPPPPRTRSDLYARALPSEPDAWAAATALGGAGPENQAVREKGTGVIAAHVFHQPTNEALWLLLVSFTAGLCFFFFF